MSGPMKALESFDSGSNYRFGDKMIFSGAPRSLFDLSHLNTLTIPRAGMLVPISLWETLPGDDYEISTDCLLRVMPQVVPLYSRQRLYIYAFYSRYSDLWCNWQVFMDKGYTGNDQRKIPTLKHGINLARNNSNNVVEPDSLFDYMGLPLGASCTALFNDAATPQPSDAAISALPFMMYLRIYRDYFMNKNHWISDRVMLPDDDSRFRLNDKGQLMSAVDQNKNFYFYFHRGTPDFDLYVNGNDYLFNGAMHDYPDDYFTSAIPFPQRGTSTPLPATTKGALNLDFTQSIIQSGSGDFYPIGTLNEELAAGTVNLTGSAAGKITTTAQTSPTASLLAALNKGVASGTVALNITLEDIRKLAINQQMLEQLARTDGSYYQFGLSFFGEPSKAAYDYRPTYIGGTYKNIAFTEVLQTATTQTTSSGTTVTNPTGAYTGHGITGISNGHIGHIHCDDFGMIMLIACIMPDVYYSQGLDKIFTEQTQEEKYLPDRSLLGFQPILNKELYYAGNNGSQQGEDNYLWAYQNPFDHLRYMPNKIHGKIADPTSLSFYPYTQARHFNSLVDWGRTFSSTNDVRDDYLTAPYSTGGEDAYTAQFQMNVRAVRPLPYKATPAKLVHA